MKKRKYHFVLSFEDRGETFYVYKYYGIHEQWWHYVVWDQFELDFYNEHKTPLFDK